MITINGTSLLVSSKFPAGEVRTQIKKIPSNTEFIEVKAILKSSDDIMELLMVKNTLDYYNYKASINLVLGYVPYARQDRICNEGEANGAEVFASLLDHMGFDNIVVADIHSPVFLSSLKTSYSEISAAHILGNIHTQGGIDIDRRSTLLIAPDKGANIRVSVAARVLGVGMVSCSKVREAETGRITKTEILVEEPLALFGLDLIVVDDICDGGMTFVLLARELLKQEPNSLTLYVTHGIFSRGIEPLLKAGFTKIITTDSFCEIKHPNLTVMPFRPDNFIRTEYGNVCTA